MSRLYFVSLETNNNDTPLFMTTVGFFRNNSLIDFSLFTEISLFAIPSTSSIIQPIAAKTMRPSDQLLIGQSTRLQRIKRSPLFDSITDIGLCYYSGDPYYTVREKAHNNRQREAATLGRAVVLIRKRHIAPSVSVVRLRQGVRADVHSHACILRYTRPFRQ